MQTCVKITKWEKGKCTLIDCESISIQEQSSQPLIQYRLMLKYGEKALEKSPNPVFLKTKTKIYNRPSQNWLSWMKNWGRTVVPKCTGTRASQGSCTVVHTLWLQGMVVRTLQSTVRLQQLLVLILLVPEASLSLHSCWKSNIKAPLFAKLIKLSHFWARFLKIEKYHLWAQNELMKAYSPSSWQD